MMTFNEYLLTQPLERRREIRRAEWAWIKSRRPLTSDDGPSIDLVSAVAGDFIEQMRGYEEPAAGGRRRHGPRPGFDF